MTSVLALATLVCPSDEYKYQLFRVDHASGECRVLSLQQAFSPGNQPHEFMVPAPLQDPEKPCGRKSGSHKLRDCLPSGTFTEEIQVRNQITI